MPAFLSQIFRNPYALVAFAFPIIVLAGNKLLAAGVVGVGVTALVWRRPTKWRAALPFAVVLALIALWGGASVIWSLAPELSFERAIRFAALAVFGVIVCRTAFVRDAGDRDAVASGLLAGLTVAACLSIAGLAWQQFVGISFLSVLNHKPFATVAAVLLFPAVGVLCAKGACRFAAAGGVALTALFLWANSLAAVVAVVVGVVVFGVVYFGRRSAAYAVSVAAIAGMLAVPALAAWSDAPRRIQDRGIQLRHSTAHRVAVWDFVGQRILLRPLRGWGLGVARMLPGGDANPLDRPRYREMLLASGISPKTKLRALPLHPHNAVLHVLLELGAPGLLLYLALGVMCFRSVIRGSPHRLTLAAAMATVTAALVIGQVSFSVWQSWWIAAQFMVAAILLALYRTET